MTIIGNNVLVTGANRGIGRALVDEALLRGAARIYAGTRGPFVHADSRVVPVILDVTDATHIEAAVEHIESLDVLINNAGVSLDGALDRPVLDELDRTVLERHLAVNLLGNFDVTQALLPQLIESRGTIVNVLSLAAVTAVPFQPTYSVSKAAAFSLTQALRALLAGHGVRVHAALPGPVDTDMTRDLDLPKASPAAVAAAILDGVQRGEEEIFPDPTSAAVADGWRAGVVKALEREFAQYVAPEQTSA
jgi:NAD(P)-dependent dehydrogenase (short-subunit alcohol dehydrogenase family)